MNASIVAHDSVASCRTYALSPIDAWFFRDGRPYNASESNQTDVVSLFPPPATTLVGAIRAGLARSTREWDGASDWSSNPILAEVLGKNFDDLGKLSFRGPYLLREEDGKTELLYPMPLHVLGKPTKAEGSNEPVWQPQCLLTPDSKATGCDLSSDLDDVRLPIPSAIRSPRFAENRNSLKEPSSHWVTAEGMQCILKGQLPPEPREIDGIMVPHVFESRDLWCHEIRVALERCENTRTTKKEGALYSPRFVRLKPGVSLVLSVTGLPTGWAVPNLMPLGGENRLADCRSCDTLQLPDLTTISAVDSHLKTNGSKPVAVTLLTPLLPPDAGNRHSGRVAVPEPGQPFFGCEGTKVISACVGKPQTLGGWDSLNRRPLDLRPVLPAGSTWFLEVDDPVRFAQRATGGFGIKRQYGFGQVALGVWPSSLD